MGETKLGIYIDKVGDGIHGTPQYDTNGGYYFVNGSDLGNHIVILSDNTPTISKDTWDKIKKPLNATTLLLSINGTLGKVAKYNGENIALGKSVCYINLKPTIDRDYLYYVLQTPEFEYYMQNYAHGATIKNFAPCQVLDFKFSIPSIKEQQRIASILSAYDTQIENNQKRIKLLEQMAENLYKEWFVRFRFPGYETVEFEGGVPKGWKYEPIKNNNDCYLGGTPSRDKNEYWDNGTIPWINSGEINRLRVYKESELITELALKKSATKLLPIRSTLVAITGATVGQVSLNEIEVCANQSVVGVVNKQGFHCYTYYSIRQNIDTIANYASGGAQQHINKEIIEKFKVLVPPTGILEQFEKEASTYFDAIYSMIRSIDLLTTQRDLLLPRLMSGKLSI